MRRTAALLAVALALPLAASTARAAGALAVSGAGVPFRWTASPVRYSPDKGKLGALDNAAATALVASTFAVWEAVPTASIAFASAGPLPVDVKASNYADFLSVCDGLSPVIFDRDGTITDDLLGVGARDAVLGFASPECGDVASAAITEATAVLNGRFVDGVFTSTNPEMAVADFAAVFLHEFGHFFNLDHSQVNLLEALDGDPANDDAVATMFPFLVNGAEAATLALDDVASVSSLYPTKDFATTTGTIRGRVVHPDDSGLQGAYVIARSVSDPRRTAVGVVSGALFAPNAPGGPPPESLRGAYEIPGLPPGTYTVEMESVDARFRGGSSVGPLDPPVVLPGPPERWNGPNEGAANPPDDPDASAPLAVVAGETVGGIDVILNEAGATNDECAAAVIVPGVPFVDTQPAAAATTAADDPLQACTIEGASQNLASVWYRFTAPAAGRVVVETSRSDYDTVLTAFDGPCGALKEVACSDDTLETVQSRLDLDLAAGRTVTIEATAYHTVVAGTLRIAFRHGCVGDGPCDDGDPCTAGDVCTDGVCAGPADTCDDGIRCTADLCGPGGACTHAAAAGGCDDGDLCTVADACASSACTSGARIDAAALATSLGTALPASCGVTRPRTRKALARRLERAAGQVQRGATAAGDAQARAFERARRLLGAVDRLTARLRKRGAVACADALAARVHTAGVQLDCVATDAAAVRS
jgi:hypothetical protein